MRLHTAITLTLALASPAASARKKAKPAPAVEAPQPSRAALVDDVGTLRSAELRAPSLPAAATIDGAETTEHGPAAAPPSAREPGGPLSGALEEVIARQMRKNSGSIERCAAEAVGRNGAVAGDVGLQIRWVHRAAQAAVTVDGVGDPELGRCLVEAARGWRLSLDEATFPWTVHVGGARAGGAGASR